MEALRECLSDMNARATANQDKAAQMREDVKSAASLAVGIIQEQEKSLLQQIDQYMSENHNEGVYEEHRERLQGLLSSGASCTDNIQQMLNRNDVIELKELEPVVKEQLNELVEAYDTRMFWAECDTKASFDLKLAKSQAFQTFIEEGSLGLVQSEAGEASHQSAPVHKSGEVIKHITNTDVGQPEFSPFAVAVSELSGNLAVLDESKRRVYIMDLEGQRLAKNIQIQYGDLWDIAYSKDDEIVVANRSNNRLLHYDDAGKFQRKVVQAPTDCNAKFTFLSVDSAGRYLVTSAPRYEESENDTTSCVCMYSADRRYQSFFGGDKLSCPKKAIYYSEHYFVPDSDRKSVLVFEDRLAFFDDVLSVPRFTGREIGRGALKDPAGIAIDSKNGNILVCDSEDHSVQVFKIKTGSFVCKFGTEGSPVQIALAKDAKKVILCGESSSGERFLQILSYISTP